MAYGLENPDGFEVITGSRHKGTPHYRIVLKCKECGYEFSRRMDITNSSSNVRCENCTYIERSTILRNKGMKYLKKVTNTILVECEKCNQSWEIQSNKCNSATCKHCAKLKYVEALKKKGCFYLDRYTKNIGYTGTIVVYENSEGIKKEVQAGKLLEGAWSCGVDKYDRKQYYTYLISFSDSRGFNFKIGVSCNVELRLKNLKIIPEIFPTIKILNTFNNNSDAVFYEYLLHKHFKDYSLPVEDVYLFSKGIIFRRDKYITDGATEWFCCDSEEVFNRRLNEFSE